MSGANSSSSSSLAAFLGGGGPTTTQKSTSSLSSFLAAKPAATQPVSSQSSKLSSFLSAAPATVNPPSPPALSVKRRIGSLPSMTGPLGSDASGKARRASVTLDAVRINKVLGRDRSASRVDAATLRAFEETGTSLAQSPSALAPLNCDAENGGVDATVDTDFDVFAVLQLQRCFEQQRRVSTQQAIALATRATEIMREEPNVLTVKAPTVVVGDIHGQYFDMLRIFELAGSPAAGQQFLFLGDYVDRGAFSCEVLMHLLALKVAHPEQVHLIRGNHECRAVTEFFGFKEECNRKYGLAAYNRFCLCFEAMPIAAIVSTGFGRILALHGGLSPHLVTLDQLQQLDRFQEPQTEGLLCDVLWSDPLKDADAQALESERKQEFLGIDWMPNPTRGCSYFYGFDAVRNFLETNNLFCIMRAHEVQQQGFYKHFDPSVFGTTSQQKFQRRPSQRAYPTVVTVFSAPNYCDRYGNMAAFVRIDWDNPEFEVHQFENVEHPEPVFVPSEADRTQDFIYRVLPYMPTKFPAFVKSAVEIGTIDSEEALQHMRRVSMRAKRLSSLGLLTSTGSLSRSRTSSMSDGACELDGSADSAAAAAMAATAVELPVSATAVASDATDANDDGSSTCSDLTDISEQTQYDRELGRDAINEFHPALLPPSLAQVRESFGIFKGGDRPDERDDVEARRHTFNVMTPVMRNELIRTVCRTSDSDSGDVEVARRSALAPPKAAALAAGHQRPGSQGQLLLNAVLADNDDALAKSIHRRSSLATTFGTERTLGANPTPTATKVQRRHTVHNLQYSPQTRVTDIRAKWEQRTHIKRESEAAFLTKLELKQKHLATQNRAVRVQTHTSVHHVLTTSPKGQGASAVRKRWAKSQNSLRSRVRTASAKQRQQEHKRTHAVAEHSRAVPSLSTASTAPPPEAECVNCTTSTNTPAMHVAKTEGASGYGAAPRRATASATGDLMPSSVAFTEEELLGLRLLFSILDRQCNNFITLAELCAYGQETGDYKLEADAKRCMDVVDVDGDGQIGFADYLQFAARLKSLHDIREHALLMGNIQEELLVRGSIAEEEGCEEEDVEEKE